jgi:hypothetical protein
MSRAQDQVLIWDEWHSAYYLADRRPITPFAVWGMLQGKTAASLGIDLPSYFGELLACGPRVVVVSSDSLNNSDLDMRLSLAKAGYVQSAMLSQDARNLVVYAPANLLTAPQGSIATQQNLVGGRRKSLIDCHGRRHG